MGGLEMTTYGVAIIDTICFILVCIFTTLHVIGRYKLFDGLVMGDYFLLASILFYPQLLHCDYTLGGIGWFTSSIKYDIRQDISSLPHDIQDEDNLRLGLKLTFALMPVYQTCVCCLKVAFLLMYKQLVPTFMKRLRRAVDGTMIVVALGYIVIVLMHIFWCQPMSSNWATSLKDRCKAILTGVPVYHFSTFFHIASDLVIYILPFFLIPLLLESPNHEKRKRSVTAVTTMFSLGFVCIVIAIVRIVISATKTVGKGGMGAFYVIEFAAPQMLLCLPMIRRLLSNFRKKKMGTTPNNTANSRSRMSTEVIRLHSTASKDDKAPAEYAIRSV